MTLHCLYVTDAATLAALRESIAEDDAVLLLSVAARATLADLALPNAVLIVALAEDAAAHGCDAAGNGIEVIDYADWVALSVAHPLQQNWT